ncbi:hypothetical protein D6833_10800 [Candidatus Parcubacteria bacterium]|nr:MAG: hypothetical protein D6833_10800 [Candidatus Parcubacteria bacterium]
MIAIHRLIKPADDLRPLPPTFPHSEASVRCGQFAFGLRNARRLNHCTSGPLSSVRPGRRRTARVAIQLAVHAPTVAHKKPYPYTSNNPETQSIGALDLNPLNKK